MAGQILVNGGVLACETDAFTHLGRVTDHVDAIHGCAAFIWLQQRGEDANCRAFTRPIRPEKAEDDATGDLEVDLLQGKRLTETLADALDTDRDVTHRAPTYQRAPRPQSDWFQVCEA